MNKQPPRAQIKEAFRDIKSLATLEATFKQQLRHADLPPADVPKIARIYMRQMLQNPAGLIKENRQGIYRILDLYIYFRLGLLIEATTDRSPRLAGLSARSLTSIAALLAGSKRTDLRQEWAAHLAGDSGHDPASWQKVKQACGFLVSAVRFRCTDIADAAWIPADAILKNRALSNLVVLIPTTAAGFLILHHEGTLGVLKSAESITAIGGVLYALIRTGRWWRNVKLPEPKTRRAKE